MKYTDTIMGEIEIYFNKRDYGLKSKNGTKTDDTRNIVLKLFKLFQNNFKKSQYCLFSNVYLKIFKHNSIPFNRDLIPLHTVPSH
jgi:hypothetical protein